MQKVLAQPGSAARTRLETELGMGKASETGGGQFGNMRSSKEVIYSRSDKDNWNQQAGT